MCFKVYDKHSKWLLFSFKMITEQDFCSSVLRSHLLLTEAEITKSLLHSYMGKIPLKSVMQHKIGHIVSDL